MNYIPEIHDLEIKMDSILKNNRRQIKYKENARFNSLKTKEFP